MVPEQIELHLPVLPALLQSVADGQLDMLWQSCVRKEETINLGKPNVRLKASPTSCLT